MSIIEMFLPRKTGWRFSGSRGGGVGLQSEGVEVNISVGGGTYYVTDPGGREHGLNYVNLEAGVGLSLSYVVTIFGSLKQFPSDGVGYIYKNSTVAGDLELSHLKSGLYAGLTVTKGSVGASADLSLIFMGIPWLSLTDPTATASLLLAKAVGVLGSTTARLEIGVASISGFRGKIF